MLAMPREPQTDADRAEFEREQAEQEKIAAQIEADAAIKSTPQVAGTDSPEETTVDEVVETQPPVTIRTTGFDEDAYPVGISAVGLEEELVFDSPDATKDVTPQVAEQVRYLDGVEVAA